MQEIEFTKEDEYCIRNFGYNTVGDYENLKQLEDKEHLIVEELEYRLQQKENIIKKIENDIKNIKDIVKKQPSDDLDTDLWIQIRMNGLLFIINDGNK